MHLCMCLCVFVCVLYVYIIMYVYNACIGCTYTYAYIPYAGYLRNDCISQNSIVRPKLSTCVCEFEGGQSPGNEHT